MTIAGDGSSNVVKVIDSLKPYDWDSGVHRDFTNSDILLTNPPFAGDLEGNGLERKLKLISIIVILLTSLIGVAYKVEKAHASGTIYIRADGSIDPPTANISTADNVTYTFTDNNYDEIVVERNNIVVDGASYTVEGTGSGTGIAISDRSNVTIQNIVIKKFLAGIGLLRSSNNTMTGNYLTANNNHGIYLGGSSNYNSLFRNNITNNPNGIVLVESHSNSISENNITNNGYGEYLSMSSKNIVTANSVAKNKRGVSLSDSPDNVLRDNSIDNNDYNFDVSASYFPTSAFINDVDESNTVNGKPVYYWINRQNDKIPADAGYIALVNSENIAVEDLNACMHACMRSPKKWGESYIYCYPK